MTIKMMFISKRHDAERTFELFNICMRYHMTLEVRSSLEGLVTILLFAKICSVGRMSLVNMAVIMSKLLKLGWTLRALVKL